MKREAIDIPMDINRKKVKCSICGKEFVTKKYENFSGGVYAKKHLLNHFENHECN
ncbi:hypothetical protein FIA58_013970 [Flavobacterium jejuense]|uniref:BED-type domain-containing protein n=1 Tax=Flavobacterium jejuense TaxID=1544455 RepID=A0ABX0IWA2_9FLAO|nr:hypothetical protein [Flavobacterium jejuense]NHN26788.1 hypothetical protein [Flavobacterium jejuense]